MVRAVCGVQIIFHKYFIFEKVAIFQSAAGTIETAERHNHCWNSETAAGTTYEESRNSSRTLHFLAQSYVSNASAQIFSHV